MANKQIRILSPLLFALLLVASCSKRDALSEANPNQPTGVDAPKRPVKLVLESPEYVSLGLEEAVPVIARVYYLDDSAAEDRPVAFAISGIAGGATLSSGRITSDADGRAQIQLVTGTDRAAFQLVLSTPQAAGSGPDPQVVVTVDVDGTYRGKLRVRFSYTKPIVVKGVTTRVHAGTLNCGGVPWPTQPPGLSTLQASGSTDTPIFEGLEEGKLYTVTASATGKSGEQVAVGCAISPAIVGRGVVTVTVPLNLNPTKFAGTYDFGSKLHLQNALPPTATTVINEIEDFFYDPSDYMATQLVKGVTYALKNWAGWTDVQEDVVEAALTLVAAAVTTDTDGDGPIDELIREELLDRMPAWVDDSFLVGGDITSLVTNLSVGGKLEVTAVDADGTLTGRWDWSDFLFQWRLGTDCESTNACCGRTTYNGDQMGLSPMGAAFAGTVTPRASATRLEYDLAIDDHRLDIQYGNIIVFAVEKVALPMLTGQDTLECAVESLFGCNDPLAGEAEPAFVCGQANVGTCGCDRVGAWLYDSISSYLGGILTPELGTAACGLAVTAGANYLRGKVQELAWGGTDNAYFNINLAGTLADDDKDLSTDVFEGDTLGSLVIKQVPRAFDGDVRGDRERESCSADGGCEAFEACQVKQDVLDDCAPRQICVLQAGDRRAGESCTAASQCASNTCLASNKCLGVCEGDLDCPGALRCGIDKGEVSLTTELKATVNACGL